MLLCRNFIARRRSMMMSLTFLVAITTTALVSLSRATFSQNGSEQLPPEFTDPKFLSKYGHLVSFHRPVSIQPSGATCTQGNITLDRSYLSPNYSGPDITYQCEANCSRTFPFPYDVLFESMGESSHWRHNGRDGVSNHQPHDCLLNCLFRRR